MKKKCEFCLKRKKDVHTVTSLDGSPFSVCEDCECNHFKSCEGCGKDMLTDSEIHTTDWQCAIPYEPDDFFDKDPDDWTEEEDNQYDEMSDEIVMAMEQTWYCDDCYPKFKKMIDDKAWDKLMEAIDE